MNGRVHRADAGKRICLSALPRLPFRALAYGNWFLRLKTPFNGIGIHGSTNNENTVPGRASEGCIRLLDQDIITLKEKYARVGMNVIVKGEEQGLLPFEEKCLTR